MTQRFVEYHGRRVVEGWPERIREAQGAPTYEIGGAELPRVRYGDEVDDWGADAHSCHDCAVVKGEYHVPGCDAEECPACHGAVLSCDCPSPDEDGPA